MQSINVFENGIEYLSACLNCYLENSAYFVLFACAVIYLIIKGNRLEKEVFLPMSFMMMITVFNPICPLILDKVFDVNNEYYRLFWIMPVVILLPYVSVKIVLSRASLRYRVVMSVFLLSLGILGGKFVYAEGINIRENQYRISDELIQIDEMIHEDANIKLNKTEYPKAFFEYDYNMEIRQYDPKMLLTIDREDYLYAVQYVYTNEMIMDDNNPQYRLLALLVRNQKVEADDFERALEATKTEYVVVSKGHPMIPYLRSTVLEEVGESEGHIVYRYDVKEPVNYEHVDYSEANHMLNIKRLR